MSQQSRKKSNIIFIIFIILLILLSVGITYYLIVKHNNEKKFSTKNIFKFEFVSRKDSLDVFKNYPINPIEIVNNENEFSISGLKNKEIENKVNEKLKKIKEKNNYCIVTFNVSNVFSAYCNDKGVSIDLNTGNDIKLEEVYQRNSDLRKILMDSLYINACNWGSYCQIPNDNLKEWLDEYDNNIENELAEVFKKIYRRDYTFAINYNSVNLFLDNNYWNNISFYNYPNDITIFDRFLNNNNIYENKILDYCDVKSCYFLTNNYNRDITDSYYKYYYLNDNTYIKYSINNNTNTNILDEINDNDLKKTKYDLNDISNKMLDDIIDKYELNKKDNYHDISIYAIIYGIKNVPYNIVNYSIVDREYNKDNFIKYSLDYYNAETINESSGYYLNMIIKNNEISYLDSNPRDIFEDFDEVLYKHIKANLKGEDDFESPYYHLCCSSQFSEGYEKTNYKQIIKDANYSLDKENKLLFMNYDWKIINIPWNIFTEKNK